MSDQPNDWGRINNPRKMLQSLRNPSGEFGLLFNDDFLDDARRTTIYSVMLKMTEQADTRHLERARVAYSLLRGESVEEAKLKDLGIYGLQQNDYLTVIASNFYSALTHLTEVLLELRSKPEGAVAGTLELLVDGQVKGKTQELERILNFVDRTAGLIFDYENWFFNQSDDISKAVSERYCNGESSFCFQQPVEEMDIHHHWRTRENFYSHHKGQWHEVNIARSQFEPETSKLGIDISRYRNIQRLYERFAMLDTSVN